MQKNEVLKKINTRLRQPLAGPGKNLSTFISRHLPSIIGWMLGIAILSDWAEDNY
jgi:hypothetical protein